MSKQIQQYENVLDKLYDWVAKSATQDMVTLMDLVTTGKAYFHAAEDMTKDELHLMEIYLERDLHSFFYHWQQDADDSIWWQSKKQKLWQLLTELTDKNALALHEMEQDLLHQGIYKTGEMVALGEVVCTQCQHRHTVEVVEHIQPCSKCGSNEFLRELV